VARSFDRSVACVTVGPTSDDADLNKLVHIKQQIGYRHALFLRLSTGAVAAVDKVREVWV
jgi:hypothetical protein